MIVEYRRRSRVEVGIAKGASLSSSFWYAMEVQAFPLHDLTWADDLAGHWDRRTDEVVVTYRIPLVLPIWGSANPCPCRVTWPWS